MSADIPVTVAVEGKTDEAVARRILVSLGIPVGPVYVTNGKARLDRQARGYNNAAKSAPWFVLRDLDTDAPCAGELVGKVLGPASQMMCFRVAVRASEAWLLADRERISEFLNVAPDRIPADPDQLLHPKTELVNLARQSRTKAIRDDMVSESGTTAVGPGYTARIVEFVTLRWRPQEAAAHSGSLARCLAALQRN